MPHSTLTSGVSTLLAMGLEPVVLIPGDGACYRVASSVVRSDPITRFFAAVLDAAISTRPIVRIRQSSAAYRVAALVMPMRSLLRLFVFLAELLSYSHTSRRQHGL